ncbi:hypothetical protein NKJ87_02595 [Mesorhizobium sp. M0027]|uniref:hypothetical protein n=1 Tax=Mesorhizobium sp. M0027 TaxID=2956848 RepID=UPI0033363C9B
MAMTLWIETLERLVELLDEKLAVAKAETGEFMHADYSAWRARHDMAEAKLVEFFTNEEGARFNPRPAGEHSVRMAGLRASSTSGTTGALTNWRTAARKKIAADDGFNAHGSGPVPIERRDEP